MQQKRMTDYRPNYPRKALRGAALTAAALVAISGTTGCRKPVQTSGIVAMPEPTEEVLVLDGEVAIPEPTEEPVTTDGMVAVPEPTEEVLVLEGEVTIEEPEPTPMP